MPFAVHSPASIHEHVDRLMLEGVECNTAEDEDCRDGRGLSIVYVKHNKQNVKMLKWVSARWLLLVQNWGVQTQQTYR